MKGTPKLNKKYLTMFFLIISIAFLSACGGVIPTDYTITATAGAGGSINPSGAIVVSEGTNQTFTISPDAGYQIADVLVDGVSLGPVATYMFTNVIQDHIIQINFVVTAPKVYNPDNGFEYETIQEAINAGQSGDTFIVNPGIYMENIVFDNKDITVRSSDPSNPDILAGTIIDGGGSGSVVRFAGGDTSTLEGFTIRNGNTISNGGGIYIGDSSPIIKNNTISGNTTSGTGGGIYIYNSLPTISGNTIESNNASDGGGIYMSDSSPMIIGNTITDNTAATYGGGIYMEHLNPTITNNTITNNDAIYGGGINVSFCNPTITGNIITGNTAKLQGGGGFPCHRLAHLHLMIPVRLVGVLAKRKFQRVSHLFQRKEMFTISREMNY
jgi:parallel beta-helix repeat protein